jgi:hypothetical protein
MQCTSTRTLRQVIQVALVSALGLLAACGFSLDPGHIDTTSDDPGCLERAQVELLRYSSLCGRTSSESLLAKVRDGMEFPAEQVRTLQSPCSEGPNPAVEVHLDHSSIIFDFSNVEQPGRFPTADFEGYVLDLILQDDNALLVGAKLDREASTLDLENVDVSFDPERIELNFEDIAYDDRGLVKINLRFSTARPRVDTPQ